VVRRPAIGICAAIESVRWGPWEVEAFLMPRTYVRAVQAAGAMALVLAPDDVDAESPDRLLDLLDGLVLAGGSDIDPAAYGARRHPETYGTRPERDRFELALAHRALERDMPLLGICRGMQLLNVARGGTLDQHLPDSLGHDEHRHTPGTFGEHEVRLEPGSLAARAAGGERVAIKSHHHQGIEAVGDGLIVTGWSVREDIAEAFEMPDRRFVLGVQWHPEADVRDQVVGNFVEEATREEART
jgi:putative glutamine amidotransferase